MHIFDNYLLCCPMKSVEDYIIAIDANSACIVCHLRSIILSCSKQLEESTTQNKINYHNKNFLICALNKTSLGIKLEFNSAEEILDPFKLLYKSAKNTHTTSVIKTFEQIDAYQLVLLVQQALLFSELEDIKFKHHIKQLSK